MPPRLRPLASRLHRLLSILTVASLVLPPGSVLAAPAPQTGETATPVPTAAGASTEASATPTAYDPPTAPPGATVATSASTPTGTPTPPQGAQGATGTPTPTPSGTASAQGARILLDESAAAAAPPTPSLAVEFVASPGQAAAGGEVSFTLAVENTGRADVTGIAFTNVLPGEFSPGKAGFGSLRFDPRTRTLTSADAGLTTVDPHPKMDHRSSPKVDHPASPKVDHRP